MKKYISLAAALIISLGAAAKTPSAANTQNAGMQPLFDKGDIVVDLGIGLGISQYTLPDADKTAIEKKSGVTFTQKASFEVGIARVGKMTIGLGAMFNNSYGAGYQSSVSGNYDYYYPATTHRWESGYGPRGRWSSTTSQSHRQGSATADADANIDVISLLVRGSVHYQFIDRLDTYATIGLGLAGYKTVYSNETGTEGLFSDYSVFDPSQHTYQISYSYDDRDHVVWNGSETTARFAFAVSVGARYYLTKNWAVNAEIGLNSADFRKGYTDKEVSLADLSILSIGASYKF